MHELRVKGLRSLKDTGAIRIAPITILLGENSSGKSTFLRTFPLLRQSVEVRTSEPLLWFGRLVDFGTFEESASTFNRDKAIEIAVTVDLESDFANSGSYPIFIEDDDEVETEESVVCTASFKIVGGTNRPIAQGAPRISSYVDQLVIEVFDTKIELHFKEQFEFDRVLINGVDLTRQAQASFRVALRSSPTPVLLTIDQTSEDGEPIEGPTERKFAEELHEHAKQWMHGRTKDDSIQLILNRLKPESTARLLASIQLGHRRRGVWKRQVLDWTENTPEFIHLKELLWGARLEEILDSLSRAISREFGSISYITPLRAAAERYYRQQGLAVNELDSKGENFAQFLRSLSAQDRESLRKWLGSSLGVYVDLEDSKGHVSLYLVDEKSKSKVNLADTGFGFSQLLPIAIQLWLTQHGRRSTLPPSYRRRAPRLVTIEQPELHLHPRVQAKVADLLAHATSVNQNRLRPSVVVETHSEALINRLGKLVCQGVLKPSDVNIVLFNKSSFSAPTTVSVTQFDSNGFLQDWPIGFFNAD